MSADSPRPDGVSAPQSAAAPAPAAPAPAAPAPEPAEEVRGMDHRRERVRVETERHRIVGYLTLARDGYRSRVSDVLNAPERDFLTLTEVTVEPLSGGPVELHPFLTLARRHIVFAVAAPEERQ
jgi:Family of unknown function (DUF6812)